MPYKAENWYALSNQQYFTNKVTKPCFICLSESLINFYLPCKPSNFEGIDVNSFAQFHLPNDRNQIWIRAIDIW